jgi:hypothetical protein
MDDMRDEIHGDELEEEVDVPLVEGALLEDDEVLGIDDEEDEDKLLDQFGLHVEEEEDEFGL